MRAHEYEVKIRTEKHGVYVDHGPFVVAGVKSKLAATVKAWGFMKRRIERMYANTNNPAKVKSWKGIMDDTIGSEVSVIVTRLQ